MLLCEKCGLPTIEYSGQCRRCSKPGASNKPICENCSKPLIVSPQGLILCTGCNRPEEGCGLSSCGIKPDSEPGPKVNDSSPDAEWWLKRLTRIVGLRKVEGLNNQGDFLVKFAAYTTFVDLAETATREKKQDVYNQAKKLIEEADSSND